MRPNPPALAARPSAAATGRGGPAARMSGRRPEPGAVSCPARRVASPPDPPPVRRWLDPTSDNERWLYGALLDDVRFLRRRGFAVHRTARGIRLGNRLVTPRGLQSIAARERRLTGGS